MTINTEIWKPIPGFEDTYEVSNMGRIRSIDRYCTNSLGYIRFLKSRHKKFTLNKEGYLKVVLCKNGELYYHTVHRLVVAAFMSQWSNREFQVNHIDGDKTNNTISNLEIISCKENRHHAIQLGLWNQRGEHGVCAKLTNHQADEIRHKYSTTQVTQKELASEYGVSKSTIGRIVRHSSYKHYVD